MAYRNDENAVEARRSEIERELIDVRSRAGTLDYLKWRAKELEAELESLEQSKASFKKSRLPMLANAKIASPCSADWQEMKGDERVRFCGSCQKNVYNLSALTSAEAETLIRQKEGDLCARMFLRDDGTVITTDCAVGVRHKWVNRVAGAAVAIGGAVAAVLGYKLQHAPIPVARAEPSPNLAPQAATNPGMLGAPEAVEPLSPLLPDPKAARISCDPRKPGSGMRHAMGRMGIPTHRR